MKKIISLYRTIFQIAYSFLLLFTHRKHLLIIYSKTSEAFGNLPALQAALNRRGVKFYCINQKLTFSNLLMVAKAKVICIDQATQLTSTLRISKRTIVVQLWHAGGAYKKFGFDAWNGTVKDYRRIQRIHSNVSYVITSDTKLTSLYANAFRISPDKVLPLGLLRSDQYFEKRIRANRKNIVLLALTFRTNTLGQRYSSFSIDELLELDEKLKTKGYLLAVRLHPSLVNTSLPETVMNWSERPLASIIKDASVLVTDFSSILFDFSVYPGRVFWYLKDINQYKIERGLYFNPLTKYPEYCAVDVDSLVKVICSKKRLNTPNICNEYMSNCDGHSCDRMIKFLLSILK